MVKRGVGCESYVFVKIKIKKRKN